MQKYMVFNRSKHKKRIVISAAYGMGNLGDEAICETIVADLLVVKPESMITVFVFDIQKFYKAHPLWVDNKNILISKIIYRKIDFLNPSNIFITLRNIITIARCDLFVWGGGGIVRNRPDWLRVYIDPLKKAISLKKKIIVWSIGVNEITDVQVIDLISNLKSVHYISVRDEEGKANLEKILERDIEHRICVVNDPVFHFSERTQQKEGGEHVIGLNIAFWKADLSDSKKVYQFVNSVASSLNGLYEKIKYKLIYLPTDQEKDGVLFSMLQAKLNPNILIENKICATPKSFLDEVSKVDVFIASRLHSIILASNVNSLPIVPIIYDEKVLHLSKKFSPGTFFTIDMLIEKPEIFMNILEENLEGINNEVVDFSKFKHNSFMSKTLLNSYLS